MTDVLEAAQTGDANEIKTALAEGGNPNVCDKLGTTPLMLAAILDADLSASAALIQAGAKVDTAQNDGMTALFFAAAKARSTALVNLLLSQGANINARDKR